MAWDDEEDTSTYLLVINHEEQYSIYVRARVGIALEMCTALPAKRVLPFFQSYLNYVS